MFDKLRGRFPSISDRLDEYQSHFRRVDVPAKTILLKEGEISKRAFLIEKGCLRMWFTDKDRDITFQFFFEGEAVSSAESFRKNVPSVFTIESIEPCTVYQTDKKTMDRIIADINEDPQDRHLFLDSLFERQYHYMRHFLSFIRDSPEERYLNLLKEKPKILQRVPLHYIATYLGITPVSLSRIRNRVTI